MHTNYIQLPPDGVGKKVFAKKSDILYYYNKNSNIFKEHDIVTGLTSNQSRIVLKYHPFTSTTGVLYLGYTTDFNESTSTFIANEELQVNGTTYALATSPEEKYMSNMNMITSYDNPYNGLLIDPLGQAYVRYFEGGQILDGAGATKVSTDHKTGLYTFYVNDNSKTSNVILGNASIVHNDIQRCAELHTTSTSGDKITVQSNKYHTFSIDQGIYCEVAFTTGQSIKTGLSQRGGFFDDDNGIYIEMSDQLYVVTRNNSYGNIREDKIPQSEFNSDKVDGSGISRHILNTTYLQKYWMDIHRGVRTRIGCFSEKGDRILMHVFQNANVDLYPKLNTSALPVRFEMENTNDTASPSVMRVWSSIVKVEGDSNLNPVAFSIATNSEKIIPVGDYVPIVSFKPKLLKPTGKINRNNFLLTNIHILGVDDIDPSKDARYAIKVIFNAGLSGANFIDIPDTNTYLQYDQSASSITDFSGTFINHIGIGHEEIDLTNFINLLNNVLSNNINGSYSSSITIAIKSIGATSKIHTTVAYKEIRID